MGIAQKALDTDQYMRIAQKALDTHRSVDFLYVSKISNVEKTAPNHPGYDRLLIIYVRIHNHVIMKHSMTPIYGHCPKSFRHRSICGFPLQGSTRALRCSEDSEIKTSQCHIMSLPGQLKRQEVMFNNYSDTNYLYLNSQFAAKF